MQFKVIKGNQKSFESSLNELPKGAEIVVGSCNNDASYFFAIARLSDAVLEAQRDKSEDEAEVVRKADIVLLKEKQAKEAAEAKAAKKAKLQAEIDGL